MPVLKDYSNVLVIQKKPNTSCIPAGIEWILHYLKIPGVNFEGFQERHDLGSDNSFYTVRLHVMSEVPVIKLMDKSFCQGREKIEYIRQLINNSKPCLISIAFPPDGRCHIVPVVEISDSTITVLWMDEVSVEAQKRKFTLNDIEQKHGIAGRGTDILFVES